MEEEIKKKVKLKLVTFKNGELPIGYLDEQKKLYFNGNDKCIYPKWTDNVGIHKTGKNFPVMVAKKFFEDLGFLVLDNYVLIRHPKKREKNEGFKKLCNIFGKNIINKVIEEATPLTYPQSGGDPDLFVYKKDSDYYFFAEVKEKDQLTKNQKLVFPILEKYLCRTYIVRVKSFSEWLQ